MKPKVASFFAGCGGLDLGFEQAGYNVVVASDNWDPAAKTYQMNFPSTKFINRDINKISKEDLKGINVNVVVGGPPCQGFSRLNNKQIELEEMEKDERNTLFEEFLRVVDILDPEVVLMENVSDLTTRQTSNGEYVKDNITKAFAEYGYTVNSRVLESQYYGVPQKRKRLFFLGTDKVRAITFPPPTRPVGTWKTVSQALQGITNTLSNMTYKETSEKTKERIRHIPPGGYYKDLPDKLKDKTYECGCENKKDCPHEQKIVKRFGTHFRRLHPDKPSLTVNTNEFIHYNEDRYTTPREMARLQTFPDEFAFEGTKTDVLKQIGNAVPPELSRQLAEHIKGYINE